MKQRIYLHIGTHKTGTTAFQLFCADNSDRLRAQGFLYPSAGRPALKDVSYGHHLLPWSLKKFRVEAHLWPADIQSPAILWDGLRDEIRKSECPSVILSSEEFDVLNPSQVETVIGHLTDFDVVPIVYLRRLDELIEAIYSTRVIYLGEKRTIDEFAQTAAVEFESMLDPWLNGYGANCHVRFYTPEIAKQRTIVSNIAAIVGLDMSGFDSNAATRRVNVVACPWYVIETARQLNHQKVPGELMYKYLRVMQTCTGGAPYDLLSPSQRSALVARGLGVLRGLQQRGVVESIPDYFASVPGGVSDESWTKQRVGPYAAFSQVLNAITQAVAR